MLRCLDLLRNTVIYGAIRAGAHVNPDAVVIQLRNFCFLGGLGTLAPRLMERPCGIAERDVCSGDPPARTLVTLVGRSRT